VSRQLLDSGDFAALIRDDSVTGATSNPTIFAKAITGSVLYDDQLRRLASDGARVTQELLFALALDDVRAGARALRATYDGSDGRDGFPSFECTPDLADDTEATIEQATEPWRRLDRPNVMIKVPGTQAGLPAIEELTRRGINVNVTLLFSIERYEAVTAAYVRALTACAEAGEPLAGIASVASFLLSRIDTKVDARLAEASPLRGHVAIASARIAISDTALGSPARTESASGRGGRSHARPGRRPGRGDARGRHGRGRAVVLRLLSRAARPHRGQVRHAGGRRRLSAARLGLSWRGRRSRRRSCRRRRERRSWPAVCVGRS
jgi:transaldolase